MNERILQLAAEAKIMTEESINMKISFNNQLKAFSEKFAKLLILECTNIVEDSDPSPKMILHEPYRSIVYRIEEHFGVESE